MLFDDLKKALSEAIMDLKPAPIPDNPVEHEYVTLDRDETDNSKWLAYISAALKDAKTFEIHCWNEEFEWIELALQYGSLKDDDWRHGKIIIGDVTPKFVQIPYDSNIYYSGWFTTTVENAVAPESSVQHESIEWYDNDGNVITEDEARTRTLEDANGNVVCTYIERNESVSSIRYSAEDGTVLPIKVITTSDYRNASRLSSLITAAYCVIYPIELAAVLLIYFKKRAK